MGRGHRDPIKMMWYLLPAKMSTMGQTSVEAIVNQTKRSPRVDDLEDVVVSDIPFRVQGLGFRASIGYFLRCMLQLMVVDGNSMCGCRLR